eukprot:gene34789-44994_t
MYHRRYRLIEPRGGESSSSSSVIGEGAYGVVFKAMDLLQGNKMVALKKIKAEGDVGGISSSALREITSLMQLDHPNVVKLENVLIERERVSLIFELVDTDLKKYMDSSKHDLPVDLVQSYTVQLLEALDVKPQNILVTKDGQLKLCDFGLARSFTPHGRPLTQEVVTKWYRPPEILLGSNCYDSSIDIWSAACVIAEMSRKRPLFLGDSDIQMIHLIFSILGTPSPTHWPSIHRLPHWRNNYPSWEPQSLHRLLPRLPEDAITLLKRMLEYDPCSRASAIEALHSPFCTPYRSDFSMEPYFPFTGIQKFPAGSPSLRSGPGSPVMQPFRQVTPVMTTELGAAAGQCSSSSMDSTNANINENIASRGQSRIDPPHRHVSRTMSSFQAVVNKVTPEPTEEYAASIIGSSSSSSHNMMDHYEGGDENDVALVAELSQTIKTSRSALEVKNNDLVLSVVSSPRPHSSLKAAHKPPGFPIILPLKSNTLSHNSSCYGLPNSSGCPVVTGKSYHTGDRLKLPFGGSETDMDMDKIAPSDDGLSSQHRELCARKLSLHYPIDDDIRQPETIMPTSKLTTKAASESSGDVQVVQSNIDKGLPCPPKRRNQAMQDLFEPPLKKQGVLTQPDLLCVGKECLSEEMDLSIRSDIDEPMLEVTADKLKRVKRSSKTAAHPSLSATTTATVSFQRPCTRGSKKF